MINYLHFMIKYYQSYQIRISMDSSLARTPLMLSLLMLLMTQAGYLDDMNAWSEDEHMLDATTASQSGSGPSQSDLIPSVEGADLIIGEAMTNTTFQYNANAINEAGLTWAAADIDTNADGAYDVYVEDMDGDGDLDIVSASNWDDTIAWYENDGAVDPSWTAADIDSNADGARGVYAADMDGDGDVDIVSASWLDDTIAWYENDGAADPSWTAADIDTNSRGAQSVYVADMDGDGDLDIVSALYFDSTIAWYENDGAADPSWTAADINTSLGGARDVQVADLDGDGDPDIVAIGYNDDVIAWYENDGAADPSWTASQIAIDNAGQPTSVYVGDMDGDGDIDVLTTSQNYTLTWYENDGAANPSWTAANIATNLGHPFNAHAADMDGDGDLDIILADTFKRPVVWYENDGAADPSWTTSTIDYNMTQLYAVYAADMDDDGDLDIVSADMADDTIAWYENVPVTLTDITGASCSISPSLPAGLSIDSSTCTISGTPTVETSNTTYTVTAVISGVTHQGSVRLSTCCTPALAVGGAHLGLGEAMTPITLDSLNTTLDSSQPVSWRIEPALPAGMNISNGTISGTPSVYALNQTYTVYAEQGEEVAKFEIYFKVGTDNPHTVVEGQPIEPIGFHDPFQGGATKWAISPPLPDGLSMDPSTGEITGSVAGEHADTVYTVTAIGDSSTGSGDDTGDQASLASDHDKIDAGPSHTCAIDVDGDLRCWGSDARGQLGDGGTTHDATTYTTSPSSTPVDLGPGRTAVSVSAGTNHTCAILDNGDLKCWGWDTTAPLIQPIEGSFQNSGAYEPTLYPVSISISGDQTCLLLNNGDLKCRPTFDYINNVPTLYLVGAPIDLGRGLTAVDVSVGDHHNCAILDNGLLKCWGRDDYGQLGDGSSTYGRQGDGDPLYGPSLYPIDLGPGRTAVAVSAGNLHTCAILDSGDVKCWGLGASGQLGGTDPTHGANGTDPHTTEPSSTPIDLGAGRTAVAISGSGNHTCAILDDGDIKCWGANSHGQIGNEGDPSVDQSFPQTVSGGFSWVVASNAVASVDGSLFSYSSDKLTAGHSHSCALRDDGQPFCWGSSQHGQLGIGETRSTPYYFPTPHQVLSPANVTSISAGSFHTCAIREDGSLICWGQDDYGQLGNGGNGFWDNSPGDQLSPPLDSVLDLGPNRTALEVSAGYQHTCAILDTGDVKCWGKGDRGQLGSGADGYRYSIPSSVVDLGEDRTAVSLGKGSRADHACAILDNGDLKCWGRDNYGQIGDGGTIGYNDNDFTSGPSEPIDLGTGRTAVAVALGGYHTCAILDDGSVKCWGSDYWGQLGDGGTSTDQASPVSVDLGPGRTAVAISASNAHTCAILDDGSVKCWGSNQKNAIGIGGTEGQQYQPKFYAPTQTASLGTGRTAVAIAAGNDHTCAILDDASMRCWGSYRSGQLGVEVFRVDVFWNNVPNHTDNSCSWPILVDEDTVWKTSNDRVWGYREGVARGWDTSALPLTTRSLSFSLVSLADSDGDGLPDALPGDYDPAEGPTPGLVADGDDDDDGIPDPDELAMGTDPTNPDTDGDGYCDGTEAVAGVCEAGPDAFPIDPSAHADTDGDGMPDTITGTSTSVPPLVEDTDDDGDGLDDAIETNTGLYVGGSDTGTDPLNPDTDFDGVCDGPNSVPPICEAGPDGNPLGQPAEGSIYGLRNSRMESIQPEGAAEGATYEVQPDLPPGVRLSAIGGVIYGTPTEVLARTSFTVWANQTDGTSVESVFWIEVLEDTDGDGLPDELPDDYDGGLVEDQDDDNDGVTDLDEGASGTDPADPDGDGDGICDGPISFPPTCLAGPDSNPFGIQHPSPLLLVNNSKVASPIPPPNHVPDATWEVSPDLPTGMALDPATGMISGTPAQAMANTTYTIWANQSGGTSIEATFWLEVLEDTDGDGMPDELPDDYDASQGDLVEDQDDDNDGSSDLDEVARGTDPRDPDTDGDGVCDGPTAPADGGCTAQVDANSLQDAGSGYLWMLCCVLLLLLLLLLPLLRRDRASEAVLVGPEPENTRADPEFIGGTGTKEDPFILAPVEGVRPGQAVSSKESITIDGMSMIDMVLTDLGQGANGDRFGMREADAQEGATRVLPIDYGEATINMVFDDSLGGPTKEGGEFTGLLRLGRASVYLSWTVRVQPDEGRSAGAPREGATTKGAAKDAEKKAKAEAAEKAKEEAAAATAAEKAAKEAKAAEEKAAKEAKAAEEKAAKEAERKPKPASKEVKKQEELKRVKSRAKSIDFKVLGEAKSSKLRTDVKKGATSLEVADASEFADAGSAALTDKDGTTVISWTGKDGNALTGVSGITRVFGKASIVTTKDDLQVLKGVGPFIEEKLNALGITTYRQIANMNAKLEEQVNKAIEFFPGRIKRDQWANQAKILLGEDVKLDEKALKQAEELERVAKKAENIDFATLGVASASEKDDLKSIKGIGPFIEEKLNALGIFTFDQVSKMTPKIEEEVNEAIEFFPGRVRRDEWARQAGELARD